MAQALPAELGTRATDFALKDVHGQLTKLADVRGQNGTVVVFICNHCPYVKAITDRLVRDAETLKNDGVSLVTINSNDAVSYPEDSFANMATVRTRARIHYSLPPRRGAGSRARLRRGLYP